MAVNTNTSNPNVGGVSGRPDSIKEALRVLDEALATGKGADLKDLVTSEYQNLKSAIGEVSPRVSESVRKYGNKVYQRASDIASESVERGREIYGNVDSSVRSNPWPVIGGVALGTFALGFIFGRSGARKSQFEFER